jgi:predicted nuclease with TOPRIM domain
MKANSFFLDSLKLAENLQREIDKAPDVLNNMLESMMPKLTNEEKIKMQSLVKESSKLMDEAKNGSVSDIQQRIDELKNKYGSANNS